MRPIKSIVLTNKRPPHRKTTIGLSAMDWASLHKYQSMRNCLKSFLWQDNRKVKKTKSPAANPFTTGHKYKLQSPTFI